MEKIILKKREKNTHKGNYGKVLVIAGSVGMAGAGIMCGRAVIKSGAGIVRFLASRELFNILQLGVCEATCIDRESELEIDLNEYQAIAMGSGLGMGKENIRIIKKVLNEYKGNLILDADGLNCVMRYGLYGNLKMSDANIVLTPHLAEAARLLEVEKIEFEDRLKAGKEISETFGVCVVMKGPNTIVVNGDDVYINNTGNPGMATGGSGDVLSGIIAGVLAQGYSIFEGSKIGVYIHGLAGDIAKEEIGEIGMTAMDIVRYTPKAFDITLKNSK